MTLVYNNKSIYNIPYEEHYMINLIHYLYPPELKIKYNMGGVIDECKVEKLTLNLFPVTLMIECDPVFTFHQCMPNFIPNGDILDLTDNEIELRQTLSPLLDGDNPKEIEYPMIYSNQSIINVCKTIPTIRKMYFWDNKIISIGFGRSRTHVMNLTNSKMSIPQAYNFDIDDGFFIMNDLNATIPPELNAKHKQWVKRNYQGFVLA
jgi:hypothetical protein